MAWNKWPWWLLSIAVASAVLQVAFMIALSIHGDGPWLVPAAVSFFLALVACFTLKVEKIESSNHAMHVASETALIEKD